MILFLVPYPLQKAPSQRFRVELFLPVLDERGIKYKITPFMDEATQDILYRKGNVLKKGWSVLKGFLKRWKIVLFEAGKFEYIFIHREAAPVGPPVFEWLLAKVWRKKIIYDFDDAIWISNPSGGQALLSWLRAAWKTKYICRWAWKVVGGNDFLCSYGRQFNDQVYYIPTCVDTENQHNLVKATSSHPPVVGWTGSHSTLQYLEEIVPLLKSLQMEIGFKVCIIADRKPDFMSPGWIFIKWNKESEISDLLTLDIGLMPLTEDPWCEGKCGFKIIQYLALGIPAIASYVGVNKKIIEQGRNGFLCTTGKDWEQALKSLVEDADLRKEMGQQGRQHIVRNYSIKAYAGSFVQLFSDKTNDTWRNDARNS